MSEKNYTNVPVFRQGAPTDRPEQLLGAASVVTEDDQITVTIKITGDLFRSFIELGELKALYMSGLIDINTDNAEKAREWQSQHS